MKQTHEFTLPDRLKFDRPEGQHDGSIPKRKAKKPKVFYVDDDQLQSDIHLPKQSVYDDQINRVSQPLSPASKNVLSLIGVLPTQFNLVKQFFINHGLKPEFLDNNEGMRNARGNWVVCRFDKNIETIDFIKPTLQISQHLIVGCFIGHFQKEECIPVPVKETKTADQVPRSIFKLPPLDEDLTATQFEEKSYFTLFREFVLGEQDIPRKRGTVLSIIHSLFY